MENDKRPRYLWIVVALANLSMTSFLFKGFTLEELWPMFLEAIFLVISVGAVLVSGLRSKWKHRLGFGIPILFLLPMPYFVYDYYTCTGKWCELDSLVFGSIAVAMAVSFSVFYMVGIASRKLSITFIKSLVVIGVLLLVGLLYANSGYGLKWV